MPSHIPAVLSNRFDTPSWMTDLAGIVSTIAATLCADVLASSEGLAVGVLVDAFNHACGT